MTICTLEHDECGNRLGVISASDSKYLSIYVNGEKWNLRTTDNYDVEPGVPWASHRLPTATHWTVEPEPGDFQTVHYLHIDPEVITFFLFHKKTLETKRLLCGYLVLHLMDNEIMDNEISEDRGESKDQVRKKKVNLIGTQGVGKTSLILRFVKRVFGDEYLKTIGTNVYKKTVTMENGVVKLIINDIMGEEAYESVQKGAFIGSTGAIAVIDITRPDTLDVLVNKWLPHYREIASEENPIILAVNKFDIEDKNITPEDLEEFSDLFEMSIFTSAKTGKNVDTLFNILASRVASNLQLAIEDIEDIVSTRTIDTTQKLVDALLAFASELGDMPYDTREDILEKAGIQKFDMDEMIEEISEIKAFDFAIELSEWYRENREEYAYKVVLGLIDKYKEDTNI